MSGGYCQTLIGELWPWKSVKPAEQCEILKEEYYYIVTCEAHPFSEACYLERNSVSQNELADQESQLYGSERSIIWSKEELSCDNQNRDPSPLMEEIPAHSWNEVAVP